MDQWLKEARDHLCSDSLSPSTTWWTEFLSPASASAHLPVRNKFHFGGKHGRVSCSWLDPGQCWTCPDATPNCEVSLVMREGSG